MLTYHELRKISPSKAREIVRKIFIQNNKNFSNTAKIIGVQRKTVKRAVSGPLHDISTKPLSSPNRTNTKLENLIILEGKNTGYRYRRLSNFIFRKYGISIKEDTVRNILKRNNVFPKKIRTKNKRVRHLYDYKYLEPFAEMQLDTKHILDFNALPKDGYRHIAKHNFPKYEWNIIDAATRTRFTAQSHNLYATFGKAYMFMVILW